MLSDCPDSWANRAVNLGSTASLEAFICDVVLYTGGNKAETYLNSLSSI